MSAENKSNPEISGWDVTFLVSDNIRGSGLDAFVVDASNLWTRKDKKSGKTTHDYVLELAEKGWELIGVTPIAGTEGVTHQLLFSFKRPQSFSLKQSSSEEAIQRAGEPPGE